jgi:hypothetical protein
MMSDERFVIQVVNHTNGKLMYYSLDSMSGGYPSFTSELSNARKMVQKEVDQVMADFLLPNGKDGLPNLLAHLAGNISNTVKMADLEITIGRMGFEPATKFPVLRNVYHNRVAEVKAEKARIAAEAKAKLSPDELDALGLR